MKNKTFKIDAGGGFIHVDYEKYKKDKWKVTAICFDKTSGINRVEFYCDKELIYVDYEKPYIWFWNGSWDEHEFKIVAYDNAGFPCGGGTPITPRWVKGFFIRKQVFEYKVSFFALIIFDSEDGMICRSNRTYCTIGSGGRIGWFYINAAFWYDWPPWE